jgi:hypothetical protein
MTTKADFNGEEWEQIAEAPAIAGLIVITASRGGTIRETLAMAKAYAEAQKDHAGGDLVGELVASAPTVDPKQFSSKEDLRARGLGKITEAVGLVRDRATLDELVDYREFIVDLANQVAERDKSGGFLGIGGERVSGGEQAAIADITAALGDEPADDSPAQDAPEPAA